MYRWKSSGVGREGAQSVCGLIVWINVVCGSCYGFLFSVQVELQVEGSSQMQRGLVQRQALQSSPEVQNVSPVSTFGV